MDARDRSADGLALIGAEALELVSEEVFEVPV
jgi:hypothetical protein